MAELKIAVIDDTESAASGATDWTVLADAGTVHFFGAVSLSDLRPYDVLIAMRERRRFTPAEFDALPNLRLLVSTGMGAAHIDLDAAAHRGITVCGTQSRSAGPVELTWALIFELARRAGEEDRRVRSGDWGSTIGTELEGRTLAIAGAGRIGRKVAEVGRALGMPVTFWSPRDDAAADVDGRAVEGTRRSREEFFATADVLTVHLRLTPQTRHCITAEDLRRMPAGACVVNTARADLLAPDALVDALTHGWISGAAVDVFEQEPPAADHPLKSLPHVVLSGHRGYVTRENYALFYAQAIEAIRGFMAGNPPRLLTPFAR